MIEQNTVNYSEDVVKVRAAKTGRNTLGLAIIALGLGWTAEAQAIEGIVPFMPGATVGVPVGALPPPGFYFSQASNLFDVEVKDDDGRKTGVKITDINISAQLLWVPDVTILGAAYAAYVVQPFRRAGTEVSGVDTKEFGAVNTVISPANLSWDLGRGFFVSAGLTVYTGAWTNNEIKDVGRNYWTIEPSLGLSYLADGWNISVHPLIDFNSKNDANDYKSGSIFVMDYTASKKFGNWELGVGGTVVQQISHDTIDGSAVAAIPGVRGRGNMAQSLTIGPILGYDFGPISVKGYFLKEVHAENIPGGNRFWLRVDVPLSGPLAGSGRTGSGVTKN